MSRLDVDLTVVVRASACVRAVHDGLESVSGLPRETATVTGHAQLAGTLDRLSELWDVTRGPLSEDIVRVRDALASFVDTFAALDAELAQRVDSGTRGVNG